MILCHFYPILFFSLKPSFPFVDLIHLLQTVPDALKNHTSGTYIPSGEEQWSESTEVPFKDVPNVGFSDMEFYYDETGAVVPGQFYCLSDNGFG